MKPQIVSFPTQTPGLTTPLLVTYLETTRILGGVSTRYIETLVQKKKLKAVGAGKARRIVYQSILSYVEREAS